MSTKGFFLRTLLIVAAVLAGVLPGAASAGPTQPETAVKTGAATLTLLPVGLPPGERSSLLLTGPRQSPRGRPLRRRLSVPAKGLRIAVAAGVYHVSLHRVEIRRRHGTVKPGAAALPNRHRLRIKVKSGGKRTLDLRYGTILNPGVHTVSNDVVKVLGDPTKPSGVVLRAGVRVRRGTILSVHPNSVLPVGLLARAVRVGRSGPRQVVGVRPVGIYEVAPNMSFDVPVTTTSDARVSQLVKCSGSGVQPYVELSDFHVSGGWTTAKFGFVHVTTGATAELHFHAAAGVKVSAQAGLSCSLNLPAIGFQGAAGPIPVYGAIRPGAKLEAGAAAVLHSGGSTDITIGAKVGGLPPSATPIVDFGSPHFDFGATVFAGVKAGLSLGAELGIGAIDAANLHVDLTNGLDFTAAPGQCSWDLDLGSFSATGELGPLSISTPSTPAVYHRNLWRAGCGAAPPSPPPPPPPAPPSPALPLVRATMAWDTDSDIDLYAWDEAGDLLYFGERAGIPGVELVEDVIPLEGEFAHPPEIFEETADPNRRYTFGICDYRGEGADVTLTVTDPGGGSRTFEEVLLEPGEGAVLTTSPLGGGYVPSGDWCRFF